MYQIGIDIGGTSVKAGLVKEGRILSWKSVETDVDAGADKVIADIAGLVNALKDDAGDKVITGVGIGCPGAVNSCSGVVDQAYNLKWEYVPLGEKMQRLTGYRRASATTRTPRRSERRSTARARRIRAACSSR